MINTLVATSWKQDQEVRVVGDQMGFPRESLGMSEADIWGVCGARMPTPHRNGVGLERGAEARLLAANFHGSDRNDKADPP